MSELAPPPPPNATLTRNPIGRAFGRLVLRLGGWRVSGQFPDVPKLVILAAPHSSGWDAVWGLAAKLAMGVRIEFMAKKELFWWPLGALLRSLGGLPIDRSANKGAVGSAVARFATMQRMWYVLAPEGTRKRVTRWKTGFWHIARAAGVPVQCAYFHYPDRIIGLGPTFTMTEDMEADVARVREFYKPWIGKNRGTE
jgi:1-acyl-sn-glycerol-3-phosphate acyltransferase